jgi:hypothetical protein
LQQQIDRSHAIAVEERVEQQELQQMHQQFQRISSVSSHRSSSSTRIDRRHNTARAR